MFTHLHSKEREVISLQVIGQLAKSRNHQLLNIQPLIPGDSGGETESINGPADTDPGGFDWGIGVDVTLDLGNFHVRLVSKVRLESVVLQDDGLKDVLEVLVGVSISSIDTAMLVVKVHSAGNGLLEGKEFGLELMNIQGLRNKDLPCPR